ncbi:MAG: DsbA family protein [Candidatus Gracilibacteria bacterium]|nr:DsbA family protein [Candidatus Gracilibacteria bacterium]
MNLNEKISLPVAIVVASVLLSGSTIFLGLNADLGKNLKTDVKDALNEYIQEQQQEAQKQAVAENQPKIIPGDFTDDDPVKGNKNAKITIVEFSEYQCPYCAKFYENAYQDILKDYVNTGKAKVVFRDLPLDFHPGAMPAALAANCARDQGGDAMYFKMHDKLFENQSTIFADTTKIDETMKQMASQLGLNSTKFSSCYDSEKYKDEIEKDIADADSVGIRGTPAFIINGQYISGAQPYEKFKTIIEQELAK